MAISNQNNKVVYTGSGTSTFAYTFKIFAESNLVVKQYTIATGATTTLTLTTDYTITGVGNTNGGNVVLTAGSFPSGLSSDYKLIITRVLPYTQTVDYVENDPFPADTHEEALDRAVMLSQQLKEITDRAIVQDETQSSNLTFPAASANKVIGWNSGGTALENKTPADLSSAFSITLSASDSDKIVKVNAAGNGYQVENVNDLDDVAPTVSDELLLGDASDSNKTKKCQVQDIVNLTPNINGKTDTVITASDEIIFGDVSDSNNLKKDTVQGILDLISSGTYPSFLVNKTGTQSFSNATATKVAFNSEVFDTNNNFDSATNYRFTPTVAGKYLFIASFSFNSGVDQTEFYGYIYKNGSAISLVGRRLSGTESPFTIQVMAILDMNGSTDYVEAYVSQATGGSLNINTTTSQVFFAGSKIS